MARKNVAATPSWRVFARKSYAIERTVETNYPMLHVFDGPVTRDDWVYRIRTRSDRKAKIERKALTEREARGLYKELSVRLGGPRPVVHKLAAV